MALKTLSRRNKKDLKWPKIIIAILSTIGIVDTGSITLKNPLYLISLAYVQYQQDFSHIQHD